MKYKLLAVDMDGTLVNSSHIITENTKDTLRRAAEKGVTVIISTGRLYCTPAEYIKELGISAPVICCNGAYIYDSSKDNIMFRNQIKAEDCETIIHICRSNNIYYYFYSDEEIIGERNFAEACYHSELTGALPTEESSRIVLVDDCISMVRNNGKNVYKFVLWAGDEAAASAVVRRAAGLCPVSFYKSSRDLIEIVRDGVCKGKSLEMLAGLMNIKKEEVIAIGDGENDVSMLRFAGMGVAMGNACDSAKAAADYITKGCDEDGAAYAINKFIL